MADHYTRPAGALLTPIDHCQGKKARDQYTRYATPACATCDQRASCTRSEDGRRIKRDPGDHAKEALRAKMTDPQQRRRYRQRQAMVEPVFSVLKHCQGLVRFRRRGLVAVRREFALHVMAYNFRAGGRPHGLGPVRRALHRAYAWLNHRWGTDALERMPAAWLAT